MSQRTKLKKILTQAGFILVRQTRHLIYRDDRGNTVVVPNHNNINHSTFKKIMKQIDNL